ncbi:MAG: alpha/beta hydrolase [Tissierellia bacterium]|jgi:pimeloyl-ACP methyl ester carboxylesterase|nr:alpha/beta hydrolase [Tissierellia bacterium]MDD3226260.1 alpha/beta hydrolase [Tissierellia bacterium]MDD3751126.1 alpha/beta hydrolase [Tissierellia bacterium]MDD4046404.1 alpha/beta hydrolase [Tissierellia bacterium]MDD4678309.1 alpha/beta hydrolase [Tissierellia bacterium]
MYIDIDGLNINYIDEGNGKHVLLLHGWGGSIQTMMPIFNILKDRFRVVTLDLPGFGKSGIPKEPWNSYDYAECINKFIEKLNLYNLILFGHSHGGRISIILASKYNIVKKLILIDSAGIIPKRKAIYYIKVYWFKMLKRIYLIFPVKNKQKRLDKFYEKFGSQDYRDSKGVMRQTMVKVINDNLVRLLANIKVPTLLIWGEKDEDTPVYMGELMEKEITDSGLVILKGAGHYSYIDNYDQFRAIINEFLKDDFGE